MNEFIIFNNKMVKVGEENLIVRACKKAYEVNGFVGVVNIKTGDIKEVIQGKALEYMAKKVIK